MNAGVVVPFAVPEVQDTLYLVADEITARLCNRPRGLVYTMAEVEHLRAAGFKGEELRKVIETKRMMAGVVQVLPGGKLGPPPVDPTAPKAYAENTPEKAAAIVDSMNPIPGRPSPSPDVEKIQRAPEPEPEPSDEPPPQDALFPGFAPPPSKAYR